MIAHIIPCVMEAEILTAIAWALAHARDLLAAVAAWRHQAGASRA